jgi:hypothetical protein
MPYGEGVEAICPAKKQTQMKTLKDIQSEDAMLEAILDGNEIGTLIRDGRTIYYANLKPLHLGVTVEGATELDVARRILAQRV